MLTAIVLQQPKCGDFQALHCKPSANFDRSTKLDLTTEPPLLGRCCCLFFYLGFIPKKNLTELYGLIKNS